MTEKRTKCMGAPSGASANKQRITLVTPRERAAVQAAGGWIDETIPAAAMALLAGEAEETVSKIAKALGEYRFDSNFQGHQLTDGERRAQVQVAADTLEAALDRMANLDPYVGAYLEEVWWKSPWNPERGVTFGQTWREGPQQLLRQTVAMLRHIAGRIPAGKAGRKKSWIRDRLLERVAHAFAEADPRTTLKDARERAASLAIACGILAPSDERQQRRRMPGPKSRRK